MRLKTQRRDWPSQRDQKVHFQDFRDRVGDGATFQIEAETARPKIISSRSQWKRRDFRVQSGDGATFQTKAETVRSRKKYSRSW